MRFVPITFLTVSLIISISAQTYVSGDLSAIAISPSGNPFIVEKSIFIPSNKVVSIDPGCIFLFKPYTTFQINGRFEINSIDTVQTVFTSFNDTSYNQNAENQPDYFDWNGIDISDSASGVVLNNALISFSVFGVKAHTEAISIKSSVFRSNGQYNFTIFEKLVDFDQSMPFSWNPAPEVTTFTESAIEQRLHGLAQRILLNLPLRKKPFVAVTPFDPMENEHGKAGRTVAEYLVGILSKNPNVILVEPSTLQSVLADMAALTNSTPAQSVQYLGEKLSAEYIITGTITDYGNTVINIRCIEVKTSRIVAAVSTTVDQEKLQEFSKVLLGEHLRVSSSVFRSALIPGWGQIFSEKPVRGGASLGLYLLGGAFTVYSGVKTAQAAADYDDFSYQLTTTSGTNALRNEFISTGGNASDQNAFNTYLNSKRSQLDTKRNDAQNRLYISIGITGAVWGLNLLDAALAGIQNKNRVKLYFSASPKNGTTVKAGISL